MKTILKYPGSKWRIADWILSFFPKHKVYCEIFFGSGALFFKKKPSYIETINDIDGDIVNLFRVCREHPDELAALINLTPFSREEFIICNEHTDDPIERARRTLVRYHQSFGTSNCSKNSWRNVQTYGGPRCATMWNYLPQAITDCCERLKQAQIENIDGIELIKRYDDSKTLIYCDPPYLPHLRKSNMYRYEMNREKHIEMLNALKQTKSMVILSGYNDELYNDALSGWNTAEKKTTAQMGKHRVEKLWMNFDVQMMLEENNDA